MRSHFARSLSLLFLFLVAAPVLAAPQDPGTVKDLQKISPGNGGFTVNLAKDDQLGRSIAILGDLDDDGVIDIASAGQGIDDGGQDTGAAFVFFMNSDGSTKGWTKISNTSGGLVGPIGNGDQFGRAMAGLGDLDGDGVEDLAVGATFDNDGGFDAGALWILFLNTDGTVKAEQKISAITGGFGGQLDPGDNFGRAVGNIGDLDGDGVIDLVIGVYDDDGGRNRGAVWILFMNTDGTVKSEQKISDSQGNFGGNLKDNDYFGHSAAPLGDFDGDGVLDIIVGSVLDADGGDNQGAVYLLFLNTDGTVKDFQKISETQGGFTGMLDTPDQFGVSVAALGDVDGDGVCDLAVGAVKDDDGGNEKGAVWILFLNPDGTVKAHQKISDTAGNLPVPLSQEDWFGSALAALGDLDGDGVVDVSVGMRFDDDSAGASGAVFNIFLNGVPAGGVTAGFSASPTAGVAPLDVMFTDQSAGDVTSYAWDFGDGGMSSQANPTHSYTTDGTYDVSLTVTGDGDADTLTQTGLVVVDSSVTAGFSAAPSTGAAPLLVSFTDQSTGPVSSWSWDFGDGGMSTQEDPTHSYAADGTYDVSLTVSGPSNMDTETEVGAIVVDSNVTAIFSATPLSGAAPLVVTFTDASTGPVTAYAWDFGDGGMSSSQSPTHSYAADGTYTVAFTASNTVDSDTVTMVDLVMVDSSVSGELNPYGCGINPDGSLTVLSGEARIGQTLTFGIDNPTGGQRVGALPRLVIASGSDPAFPCGSNFPNFGMAAGTDGELLVDLGLLTSITNGPSWLGPGIPAPVDAPIDNDISLIGLRFYVQGLMVDTGGTNQFGLTTGIEVVIGP